MIQSLEENVLNKLVGDAAFLHREFVGHRTTDLFRRAGGSISYAFDYDVILTYCAPWSKGPAEPLRMGDKAGGSGQLLPRLSELVQEDDHENGQRHLRQSESLRAISVARILAEDWLREVESATPEKICWQFPAHFDETDDQIKWLHNQTAAPTTIDSGYFGKLALLVLRSRLADVSNAHIARQRIQETVEALMHRDLFGPNKRVLERANFDTLESRFSPRQSLTDIDDLKLNIPDRITSNPIYGEAYELLVRFWTNSLSDRKIPSSESNKRDARCLASLAIMNKQLLDAGISHRIIFVTGSHSLAQAAYGASDRMRTYLRASAFTENVTERFNNAFATEYRKWIEFFGLLPRDSGIHSYTRWFDRFSLHYVRHVSANANSSLIDKGNVDQVNDLFLGLFAKSSDKNQVNLTDIEDIAVLPWKRKIAVLNESPRKVVFDTLRQWDELTFRAIQERRASELGFPAFAAEIIRKRLGTLTSERELTRMIEEQVNRQRDRSMLELSDVGARSLLERRALAVRNPPDLFFATLSKTNAIFENLYKTRKYSEHPETFLADYDAIAEDCKPIIETRDGDDRQLSYLKFLVLGAVFASAERWGVALGHAERAINAAVRYPEVPVAVLEKSNANEQSHISGREAYFLASVCKRMIAKNQSEVEGCLRILADAENAYQEDLRIKPALGNALGTARFRCERLAILLSSYYFDRAHREALIGGSVHCSEFDVSSIYDAANKLAAELTLAQDEEIFLEGPMSLLTKVSIATNLLQVAVIKRYRERSGCLDLTAGTVVSSVVLSAAVRFLGALSPGGLAVETTLVRAYRIAGTTMLGELSSGGRENVAQIETFFSQQVLPYSMPYDEWRFGALKRFIFTEIGLEVRL